VSPLLNYTTTVEARRTIGQVHSILVEGGARQIMTEYSEVGSPIGVTFAIVTGEGLRAFNLPVKVESVRRVMARDPKTPRRFQTPEQAERVAWRIMKDWLEAQLAIVETEMVTFDEVMLPYMRSVDGRTMYAMYVDGQLPALAVGEET
jgi:hypothetical protein